MAANRVDKKESGARRMVGTRARRMEDCRSWRRKQHQSDRGRKEEGRAINRKREKNEEQWRGRKRGR